MAAATRRAVRALVAHPLLTALVVAGCSGSTGPGDATGPGGSAAVLTLTAPATRPVSHTFTDASNQRSVACSADLAVSASGQDLVLDSALITYVPTGGGTSRSVALSAAAVAALWADTIRVGTTRTATYTFRQPTLFSAKVAVAYHAPRGEPATATATTACTAPLLGTYVLSSINEVRMPAGISAGMIFGDTLTFAADLTFTTRGRWDQTAVYGATTPPAPYDVVGPDSLVLSAFLPGVTGGLVTHSGTTLSAHWDGCCGRPGSTFRWDSLGSRPALPDIPGFKLSTQDVRFTVVQGAPLPPPDTVAITSATGLLLQGISFLGSSPCLNNICPDQWLAFTWPGYFTPTQMTFRVTKTSLPAGTYTDTIFLTSPDVGTNVGVINVTLTVTAP